MKQNIAGLATFLTLLLIIDNLYSQKLVLGKPDSLFPVTNKYNYQSGGTATNVFGAKAYQGKYCVWGNFTSLSVNSGSSLVIDTTTQSILTSQKWKINGRVVTCIPDGEGGFYIGGYFTKIGDSSRNYLAQINKYGQPSNWNPNPDGNVLQISKRNDTLFVCGAFAKIFDKTQPLFSTISLTTDTVIPRKDFSMIKGMEFISAFLIDHDTIIYAGQVYSDPDYYQRKIRKYNLKKDTIINWQTSETEYVRSFKFNFDSSIIVYTAGISDDYVKGISKANGSQVYKITVSGIAGIGIIGNKAYIGGGFYKLIPDGGDLVFRDGFAVFDATTGQIYKDVISYVGGLRYMDAIGDKIYLSGELTSVQGISRNNFAELDTGSYKVSDWQLSPTDELNIIAFSNNLAFVSGAFNGVFSAKRNGFAIIDSATNTVLPGNMEYPISFKEGKKIDMHGDTLYALGVVNRGGCSVNDYTTALVICKTSTGEILQRQGADGFFTRTNDFEIDGQYLYINYGFRMVRYSLPSLLLDRSWGSDYVNADLNLTSFSIKGDTIYATGDNSLLNSCSSDADKWASLYKFSKLTGAYSNGIRYGSSTNSKDWVIFWSSVLDDDKLYIQGRFTNINDSIRPGFACIKINDGSITAWKPNFPGSPSNEIYETSPAALKIVDNNIWFGSSWYYKINDSLRSSFVGIDKNTGDWQIPLLPRQNLGNYYAYLKQNSVSDYVFNGDELVLVGSFDSANGIAQCSLLRYKIKNVSRLQLYTFNGAGNWDNPLNWDGNNVPPSKLPENFEIIINPVNNQECVLNVPLSLPKKGKLTIAPGKHFRIQNNLTIVRD